MAKLSPVFNDQTVDINGNPLVGAKVFTYAAGSSTKIATFTDAAGLNPQTNPIILNALGYPTLGPIWLTEGVQTKLVLAPATDTDPPTSPIRTIDNVQGVNDSSTAVSQWTASGTTPTYVSASSFTLVGDQTSAFQPGRREQFTTSGGTVYGNILTSVFTTLTTVTMQMDGIQVLDAGLSAVNHSILLTSPLAEPSIKTQSFQMGSAYGNYSIMEAKGVTVASAATTPIFAATDGNLVDISGSAAVTSLGNTGLTPGYTIRGTILGTPTFTPSASLVLNGNALPIVARAGDTYEARCDSATTVSMTITRADGKSAVAPVINFIQEVEAAPYVTYTSTATGVPYDDTIPQIGEGTQILTLTITPTLATSKLVFICSGQYAVSTSAAAVTVALFQGATVNSIASTGSFFVDSADVKNIVLMHEQVAGVNTALTFTIRFGPSTGTAYVNGTNAARRLGGVQAARFRVMEVAP